MKAKQLWFNKPYSIEIREQALRPLMAGEVLVTSLYSGISAGTEMLVYRDQIPQLMSLDMELKTLKDQVTGYPLQYGYATVGQIEDIGENVDKSLMGKRVFAYQPHASHFISSIDEVLLVPDDIETLPAIFLANMETAVNLILDGQPGIGEHVVVLGQGIVGLLVSSLLAKIPLAGLYALDRIEKRRTSARQFGVTHAFDPDNDEDLNKLKQELQIENTNTGADLVYELSGAPETLNTAIDLCGFGSRIVVGSWYGSKSAKLDLGGNFHRNRIQITGSQVSTIAPTLSGRWNRSRRFVTAWEMIREVKPEQLVTHPVPFDSAADVYGLLHESPEEVLQAVLVHQK